MKDLNALFNAKKVPLELHDSLVVAYVITKKKIHFRFAVPCWLAKLSKDDGEGSFYLIDFIAYEPSLIDYELSFLDSILPDVISFEYIGGEYRVIIDLNGEDWNKVTFDAPKTEWTLIKKIDAKELDNVQDCDFRYIEYP